MSKPVALSVKEEASTITRSGYRVRYKPVTQGLIQKAIASIKDPDPPIWENPDKDGRKEPNPNDPEYLRTVRQNEEDRVNAITDVMVIFGCELLDDIPPLEEWLPQIQYLSKRNKNFNLDEFDLEDRLDLEYIFKKFVVLTALDYVDLAQASGVSEGGIQAAIESFPGSQERGKDRQATQS